MHYWGHFCTVTKHRYLVFIHCVKAGIPIRGLLHDLSKFSPVEFLPGAKYYTGKGSPIPRERADIGYSKAWIHHKAKNKHHLEYWQDYDDKNGTLFPVEIPPVYMTEMFCDMLAANKVYRGKEHTDQDGIKYFYNKNMAQRMHPKSAKFLENCFKVLADKGEKEVFKYIRKARKDYAKGNSDYHI